MPKIHLQTIIKAKKRVGIWSFSKHRFALTFYQKNKRKSHRRKNFRIDGIEWYRNLACKTSWNLSKFKSKITEFEKPNYFVDEMVKGAFKSFKHRHYFEDLNNGTLMIDIFEYRSPLGFLGKLANKLFLKKHMTSFLIERNNVIKESAESEKWKEILK